jgi:hypothetical protein
MTHNKFVVCVGPDTAPMSGDFRPAPGRGRGSPGLHAASRRKVGDTPRPALRVQCLTEGGGTPRFLSREGCHRMAETKGSGSSAVALAEAGQVKPGRQGAGTRAFSGLLYKELMHLGSVLSH